MKTILIISVLIMGLFVAGCFNVGSATFPEPATNFEPKKEFAVPADTLWKVVQATLDGQRINIVSMDKADGRITTDYVQGPTQMNLVPGMPTLATRYKYNIIVSRIGDSQSRLSINCTLESSSESMAWHDISKDNAERVTSLENWLYEQIERGLGGS